MIVISLISVVITQQVETDCGVCQRTVYQLKFDMFGDCGHGTCKNTCHKVVNAWHAPNNIFADFEKDVLGKCDICFRAGFCNLVECDVEKSNELRIVEHTVEMSEFTGKLDEATGRQYIINENDDYSHLFPENSIQKIKENLRKTIEDSIETDNGELTANEINDLVENYIAGNETKTDKKKFEKKNVVFHNFVVTAKIVSDYIDKAIDGLKVVLADFEKMDKFKTVSPVENIKKKKAAQKKIKGKVKGVIHNVKHAIKRNSDVVSHTIDEINKTVKTADKFEKKMLTKKSDNQTDNVDELDLIKKGIEELIAPLTDIFQNMLGKEKVLKSLKYRLK